MAGTQFSCSDLDREYLRMFSLAPPEEDDDLFTVLLSRDWAVVASARGSMEPTEALNDYDRVSYIDWSSRSGGTVDGGHWVTTRVPLPGQPTIPFTDHDLKELSPRGRNYLLSLACARKPEGCITNSGLLRSLLCVDHARENISDWFGNLFGGAVTIFNKLTASYMITNAPQTFARRAFDSGAGHRLEIHGTLVVRTNFLPTRTIPEWWRFLMPVSFQER